MNENKLAREEAAKESLGEFDNIKCWVDQMASGDLKEAVNLFIWRWGHPQLTLAQAEKMAVTIFNMLADRDNVNKFIR